LIVQKYGGSSVATPEKITNIAKKIRSRISEENKIAVVVSAMGKTTDGLIALAGKVSNKPAKREMDMLLATGEQVTTALLSMALNDIGVPAISFNAFQLQIVTNANYSNARIKDINLSRLMKEFEDHDVVVITGFQGITEDGDITTLGRGGSDTSAVAIAAKMGVSCEIYSDVEGIYTCDPRLDPHARKLDFITYEEMLEMSSAGAKVLHSRAVEIAKKYSVDLYCASTFSEKGGTHVVSKLPEWLEQPVVTGIASDPHQMKFTLSGIPSETGFFRNIFVVLAQKGINIDMLTIVNSGEKAHVNFTVVEGDSETVKETIEEVLKDVQGWTLSGSENVTKISLIGVGMETSPGVAARAFDALKKYDIKILGTTTSEIKIAVLVGTSESDRSITALAEEFDLDGK